MKASSDSVPETSAFYAPAELVPASLSQTFIDNDDDGGFGGDDLPDISLLTTQTDDSGIGALASIKRIERVHIGYAKIAKKVDVRKLKENLWTLFTTPTIQVKFLSLFHMFPKFYTHFIIANIAKLFFTLLLLFYFILFYLYLFRLSLDFSSRILAQSKKQKSFLN